MTAKLATVDDHILAGVEAPGAMDDRSIVPGCVSDKPQGRFMQFDSGYLSPYFVTDPERMEVAFGNAYILIHEKQIDSKQDLLPLLEQITKSGKPLVIIAGDVGGEALATLVVKKLCGPLQVAAVRTAGFGDQGERMLQSIAILTGGKAITEGAPSYTQQTPEQLQQLVAPIALYPDSLVAQVLAACTFPDQVVEADRWVQAHPDLKGDALAKAVDQQTWDPSVKALTAFPTVLGNMDKNLSWTSSLGDAYYNQQQDLTKAVQVMRQRAEEAGNLKTTPQQTVESQGSTIEIQPANPNVVYVPAYDPWDVYGYSVDAWPGWYPYPGIWFGGPLSLIRHWLRSWLLWRLWLGLEQLGIQLEWRIWDV
jgi:hypothetical protein